MRVALLSVLALTLAHDCFNCATGGECEHYGSCNKATGACECPAGFGGANCSQPLCGGLPDNNNRPLRAINETCACSPGWSGVNCNMCTSNSACEPFMLDSSNSTARCYTGGELVDRNFHMCNVTNRKLLDILKGRRAEVSFECTQKTKECGFQLWIDAIESFYCQFSSCEFDNQEYKCADVKCQCRPGELLCGKEGSLDLSEWLEKTVKGPGNLECKPDGQCKFEEPEMDKLIKYVFGDSSIELQCDASECLHYSQVPGYRIPPNDGGSWLASAFSALVFGSVCMIFFYFRRESVSDTRFDGLAEEEPVAAVTPVGVYFEDVQYFAGKQILHGVSGSVPPGSVMAIMGGSGAGKTTLLDILAAKHKTGKISGTVRLNGAPMSPSSDLRQLVGFVDQTDEALIPTQTVYEHVLFSALLRLPSAMSRATKELRVLQTLNELQIEHLRDQLVGCGLSGGERKRVMIACELVTSPSVLLLDEPTSGLDAYSAFHVVENLVNLAKSANRTVIFTIHQPRSNIVSLFDQILLLAQGELVYTGGLKQCEEFFEFAGHKCPSGYNFADYIVDVSMQARYTDQPKIDEVDANLEEESLEQEILSDVSDEECIPEVHTTPLEVEPARQWQDLAFHQSQISRTAARAMAHSDISIRSEGAQPLASAFKHSVFFADLQQELTRSQELPVTVQFVKRPGFFKQFSIISGRVFSNLRRDPLLVLTHYGISVVLGVVCGYLYFRVSNDIPGFQNRLGLFFFLLAVFGFSTLSSISLFMREKVLFKRERANGYYSPLAYYVAKVLLDTVPLRIGPPLLLGALLYPVVGLNGEGKAPIVFLTVLMLFNLSAASLMLIVGIVSPDFGVASLTGCMVNLFGILFAGLFLNQTSMPTVGNWARQLSIYHYAYEALAVNEARYLTLVEDKFGLKIEVPGATILSAFGFDNGAVPRDIIGLIAAALVSVITGYICLHKVLVERR